MLKPIGTVMMASGATLMAIDLTGAGNRLLAAVLSIPYQVDMAGVCGGYRHRYLFPFCL